MPKSNKKQRKNNDFTKTKLKVGKKKPAAANSTNVSFKTQSINILSQLEEKDEPTNSRNLSLKDILSQLSHYNENTRQDAMLSLKSFFIQHPATLHDHLSNVVSKLLEKSVDTNHMVRKNFISCLIHIFKNVTAQEIQPFFSLVLAHLNCAMTHINDDIQLDSLQFLDVCINHFPMLFMEDCAKVLHSLLNLVSYKQAQATEKPVKGNKRDHKGISLIVNQNLSINPTGKLSSVKSKHDVLERLLQITSVLFHQKSNQGKFHSQSKISERIVDQPRTMLSINKYGLSDEGLKSIGNNYVSVDKKYGSNSSQEKARKLIMSYMPALIMCWNDCNPSSYSIPSPDKCRESSVGTMSIIVDIIQLAVTSHIENSSSVNTTVTSVCINFQDFLKSFMNYFPYTDQRVPFSKKTKTHLLEDGNTIDLTRLNLQLCGIFAKLAAVETFNENPSDVTRKVLDYIKLTISESGQNKISYYLESIKDFLKMLYAKLLLPRKSTEGKYVNGILQEIFLQYEKTKNLNMKMQLLSFLEDYQNTFEERVPEDVNAMMNSWLNILPFDLQQASVSQQGFMRKLIDVIKKSLIQCQTSSQTTQALTLAIAQIAGMQAGNILTKLQDEQNAFIELLFYIPKITKDITQSFALLCHHDNASLSFTQKTCNVIFSCFKEKQTIDLSVFLSFLCSIVLGISRSNLELLQKAEDVIIDSNECGCLRKIVIKDQTGSSSNKNCYEDHVKMTQNVLDILQTLDCKHSLFEIFQPMLDKVMTEFKILTWKAVLGIFLFVQSLSKWRQNADNESSVFYEHLSQLQLSVFFMEPVTGNAEKFKTKCMNLIMNNLVELEELFVVFIDMMNSVSSDQYSEKDITERVLYQLKGNERLMIKVGEYIKQQRYPQIEKFYNSMINAYHIENIKT